VSEEPDRFRGRALSHHIKKLLGTTGVRDYSNDRRRTLSYAVTLGRPHWRCSP